jgi:membrane associated rhomboid family serine protease
MDIISTLKYRWATGSMLLRIIFVNIAVFLVLHIATLIMMMFGLDADVALRYIEFPSSPAVWLYTPWTIITYMFAQYDFFHLLFNMLWLYWFGEIFLLADTSKRLLSLYIYGGICGALLFMLCYNITGAFGFLIGSSAAVIAIVTATAIRHPDYRVGLLFLGDISLKWLAIITIAIDFLSIGGSNAGGHIAHIGGAIIGAVYAVSQKKGHDITKPFNSTIDAIVNLCRGISFKRKHKAKAPQNEQKSAHSAGINKTDEKRLDEILDKVKRSGYGALSAEEKRQLFDVSNRIK